MTCPRSRLGAFAVVLALVAVGGASALTVRAYAHSVSKSTRHHRVVVRHRHPVARRHVTPSVTDPLQTIGVRTAPAVTAHSATDPSGVPMPIGNVRGWDQVFTDNFQTSVPIGGFSNCVWDVDLAQSTCSGLPPAVAAKWWAYGDGTPDTAQDGLYEPSQVVSIHNGLLDFWLHSRGGEPMVAALLPKIPGDSDGTGSSYGAYAIRFKASALPGYKVSFLLWPDQFVSGQPSKGEIDFPEGDLSGRLCGFMHWNNATNGNQQYTFYSNENLSTWHTAVVEWTPGSVKYFLDGRLFGVSSAHIPTTAMHWVLQVETSTDGAVPAASESGHVLVAWVAAYRQP